MFQVHVVLSQPPTGDLVAAPLTGAMGGAALGAAIGGPLGGFIGAGLGLLMGSFIITDLARSKTLKPEDLVRIASERKDVVADLLHQEETDKNPLSPHELGQLRNYYVRIQSGEMLSLPDARDFNSLVEKLKSSRSDHAGTWVLAGLAGLALGVADLTPRNPIRYIPPHGAT